MKEIIDKRTDITQKCSKLKRSAAFTLAEVLITLGIIGIVAAMTIPTLQNNSQKTEYLTALKKAYAITNQALLQMSADMGCPGDLKCTGLFTGNSGGNNVSANQALGTEFVKYFKVIKKCETSAVGNIAGCWAGTYNQNYDKSDTPDIETFVGYKFVTADGMSYRIHNRDCSDVSANKTGHLKQACATIGIDINGPNKKPNAYGKDIFIFWISNGKGPLLYPIGGLDDAFSLSGYWRDLNACTPSDPRGIFCTGRIIEEGWQINY